MQAATTKSTKSTESKRVGSLKRLAVEQLKKEFEALGFPLNPDQLKKIGLKYSLRPATLNCSPLKVAHSALSREVDGVLAGNKPTEYPVLSVDDGKRTLTVQLSVKTSSPSTKKPGAKLMKIFKDDLKQKQPMLLDEFAKVRREQAEVARVETAKQIDALKKEAAEKVRAAMNLTGEQNKLLDEELAKDDVKREKRRLAAAQAKRKADESDTDGEETDGEKTDGEETDE